MSRGRQLWEKYEQKLDTYTPSTGNFGRDAWMQDSKRLKTPTVKTPETTVETPANSGERKITVSPGGTVTMPEAAEAQQEAYIKEYQRQKNGGEAQSKFNGWKYFRNLGQTLLNGVAGLAASGAWAEDRVTDVVDTIFQGAGTHGSGLFNALYNGRPDWKVFGENGLIGIRQEQEALAQERADEIAKIKTGNADTDTVLQDVASFGGDTAAALGGALPMAAEALLTGGAGMADDLIRAGTNVIGKTGILDSINATLRKTLTSREYWTAFATEVGQDYQEALADGATETEASNYAVSTALLNSVIEIGGGIQNVPENFSVKNLLRSAAEEGMEEVEQGPVGRLMKDVVYGKSAPVFSVTDENAVLNPKTAAQEFAGGFAVGGLMSGGQAAARSAMNRVYQTQYEKAVQQVRERAGITGSFQTSEDGRTSYNDNEAQIRSVVKDGKVELASGETVDPKDVRFKDQQTADLYEGAISSAENAGAAQVFVDSYTGGDVSQYLLGMQQAYAAGRSGIAQEDMTPGTFADDLSRAQFRAAYAQGQAATEAEFPVMRDMGLGENGSAAWAEVQRTSRTQSKGKLQAGFTVMYQAGLRREAASSVKSAAASALPQSVQTAAYKAGLSDAAASLAREKAGLDFVSSAGSESGLVDSEYAQRLAQEKAGTAALLNTMGKELGLRVEIVPTVRGGSANGQYVASRNLIQIAADADNAIDFVAAHEVTHRMQELAPEEYRAYRDHAMRYRARESGEEGAAAYVERYRAMGEEAGVKLTQEEAMDEIAADFTRDMMANGKLFESFAKENRPAAKRMLDALKAFIEKIKALFRG